MPWMIEMFRREDRSWQISYRIEARDEAAANATADRLNQVNDGHVYKAAWFDDRPYEDKLTTNAPDQPRNWGYEDHRGNTREGVERLHLEDSVDLGGC